ncbi:MAG: FAD:protein FMN transferase [Nitrospirae bacterium]|nr:FAD:protein FMN transferase [Nitrospirota bacterium]
MRSAECRVRGLKSLTIPLCIAGWALPILLSGCSPSQHIYKRSQLLMGTIVEITAVAGDEESANRAMTAAFNEIRRLEDIMSTYKPASDISRVNASAGLNPVKVHKDLILAVKKALIFAEMSGGAFNIALGPAIDLWNVAESKEIPSRKELSAIKPLVDYKNIIVDEKEGAIFLKKRGMRINLGGIGKGIAADYAYDVLKRHGIKSGIIAVAGDLRVFGKRPDGNKWGIGITHPRKKEGILATAHLADMSMSTSGDYERFFIKNNIRYHHILSPDTLQPARGFQSVSIIARDSTTSDALSTAIFAMGPDKGLKLVEKLNDVEAVIVREDGRTDMSSRLKEHPDVAIEFIKESRP